MLKKHKAALLIIFVTALGLRLWFLARLQNDLVFHLPSSDPQEFNFLAFWIKRHDWFWPGLAGHIPFHHTPLYPYFMAVIYQIFGFHINAVVIVQCLLGALSACLMYLLTLRLANPLAALVCAGFMTFYWFMIYTQVFLFSECLAMTINIALIYDLIVAKDSLKKYLLGGFLFGASLLCRPDLSLFAGLILLWIWRQDQSHKRALCHYGAFILTVALVLAPVLFRNHEISGSWTLRSQVASNLYLGNDPDSYGSNIFVEGGRLWQNFITMPYRELHNNALTESQVNNFYFQKTFEKIEEHPFSWARLIFGKVWSFLTGREFLRSEDVYFRNFFVVPTSLQFLSTSVIFVFAISGFFAAWKLRERYQLLNLFLLSSVMSIFFPAKTRYLVPIIPFVMFYAAFFVSTLYEAVKTRDKSKLVKVVGVFLACVLASFINPLNLKEPDVSETYYSLADNLFRQKDYGLSQQFYQRALALNPFNSSAWNGLSSVYFLKRDFTNALYCLGKAAETDGHFAEKYILARNVVLQGLPVPLSLISLNEGDVDSDDDEYVKTFQFSPVTKPGLRTRRHSSGDNAAIARTRPIG
ncbi:MAG: glycosyltransferase family 39 protein [Candidatus Omnitrophica bacterium]|nr:glycosyltransferase family 39 protein [Candidatus Omnitrophota bacterium]